jgi:hypothetical protein
MIINSVMKKSTSSCSFTFWIGQQIGLVAPDLRLRRAKSWAESPSF